MKAGVAIAIFLLIFPVRLSGAEDVQALYSSIAIENYRFDREDDDILFSAQLAIDLDEELRSALLNGIKLNFFLETAVRVPRYRWIELEALSRKHRFELQFHNLSRKFVVRHVNNKSLVSFFTLSAALEHLEILEALPILQRNELEGLSDYRLRFRYQLDVEQLPLPIKVHALTHSNWRLSSAWHEGSL